ncbi:hypothetical protein SLEP1_g58276 [Rubroshorea leprosula]|uniref:Uncharacterized protein n=1 Tax=Rubroshorea leprosula TaxID=152421 RepID=A0AAV5MP10_9ROSI|nr:hypothetical protein SLEP1_g58276 [Rubroshorea leprosula]
MVTLYTSYRRNPPPPSSALPTAHVKPLLNPNLEASTPCCPFFSHFNQYFHSPQASPSQRRYSLTDPI